MEFYGILYIFAPNSETKIQINIEINNTLLRVKTKNIMGKMIYTKTEINRNFKIKVFGFVDGKKVNMLVGVSGACRMIGEDMFSKLVNRAFNGMDDKCVCKLRRGLKVTFYVH